MKKKDANKEDLKRDDKLGEEVNADESKDGDSESTKIEIEKEERNSNNERFGGTDFQFDTGTFPVWKNPPGNAGFSGASHCRE